MLQTSLYTDKQMWPEYEYNMLNCTFKRFPPIGNNNKEIA